MLVIEDGTGLSNAESYWAITDVDDYFTSINNPNWSPLSDEIKEPLLRLGSRNLDLLYGYQFNGKILNQTQALLFPRTSFTDANGFKITGIPLRLKQATAELSLLQFTFDVAGPSDGSGNIMEEWTRIGTLQDRTFYFSPSSPIAQQLRKITLLLNPLLVGSGYTVQVARG